MKRAFTMIELLLVVAVIFVLAGVAVPNFLEAQVRTKVSRTRSDMIVVRAALRAYYADYHVYPPNNPASRAFLKECLEKESMVGVRTPADSLVSWTSDDESFTTRPLNSAISSDGQLVRSSYYTALELTGSDLKVLTTPVRYFSSALPVDPFADRRGALLNYINLHDLSTTMPAVSKAPYLKYMLFSYGPDTDSADSDFPNPVQGPHVPYDPTNGTVSPGNLYEFGL